MDKGFVMRHLGRCGMLALVLTVLMMVLGTAAAEAYGSTESVSRFTGKTYTHNSAFANAIIVDGIDVSYVQKNNVDWRQAKADGIDYAIIRVGARGYGQAGKLIEDDYYKENIRAAKDAGLMVGVYFFSQALDTMEAWAEANYTLELIEGFDLDLPVYMDYEFAGGSSGRLTNAQLSKIRMTENAVTFLETIEEAGYEAGFYANRNFLNNTVDGKAISERWPVWVAQYDYNTDYANTYHMWQYSSSGYVNGYSGRLDVNHMYLDAAPASTSYTSIAETTATITSYGSYTYTPGVVHEPQVSVTQYGLQLLEGVDYEKFYLKNANAGTGYILLRGMGVYTDYKLIPFNIKSSSNIYGLTVEKPADKSFNGSEQLPGSITVRDTFGNAMVEGLDYTYTVKNASQVGTATVTVQLMGNYTGTLSTTYQIVPGGQAITADQTVYDVKMGDAPFALTGISASGGGKISYASSDEAVVSVSQDGMVTIVGPGTATITVKAAAAPGYNESTLDITVNVKKLPQTITTKGDKYSRVRLSKAFNLGASVDTDTKLVYESADTSIAKVASNGRVSLISPGTTEITITAPGNAQYEEAVKVVTVTLKDNLSEDAYEAKYADLKAGVEKTKVVSLKAAEAKPGRVVLTWKKSNSGYGLDYFQVWKSKKKSSGYKKILTSTDAEKKKCINTADVKAGQTYWYKVRGVRELEGKLVYTEFKKIQVKIPEE